MFRHDSASGRGAQYPPPCSANSWRREQWMKFFDNYWAEQDVDDGAPEWPTAPKYTNTFYNAHAVGSSMVDYVSRLTDVYDTEWCGTGDTSPAFTLHRNQYPGTFRQWGVHDIFRVESANQPHLACVHIDDAAPEEGLRPSELFSAIKLMKQAVRLDKLAQFPIYPIYVYSFSDHKARILEIHYEAGKLFVRKTPYVDFAEEDKEKIKLFLRWMLNRPISPATLASGKDSENVSDESSDAESAMIHSSKYQ